MLITPRRGARATLVAAPLAGLLALTPTPAHGTDPDPGAQRPIVFAQAGAGSYDLFRMAADGSDPVALTWTADVDETQPTWSPDLSRIAFTRRDLGGNDGTSDIWVIDRDGSGAKNLTSTPGVDEVAPTWSPDGSAIAYSAQTVDGHETDYDIWRMAADGTGQTNLTGPHQDLAYDDLEPDWSPDGSRIAFSGVRDGGWSLLTIAPDGSDEQLVTNASDRDPSWSPDGTRLAFMREGPDEGAQWDIFVVDADGSHPTALTSHPAADMFPSWSADGTRVLFSSTRADRPSDVGTDMDIYAVEVPPPGGSAALSLRRLTTSRTATSPDWAAPRRTTVAGRCAGARWSVLMVERSDRTRVAVLVTDMTPRHRWRIGIRDRGVLMGRWVGRAPADGSVRFWRAWATDRSSRVVVRLADLTTGDTCRVRP